MNGKDGADQAFSVQSLDLAVPSVSPVKSGNTLMRKFAGCLLLMLSCSVGQTGQWTWSPKAKGIKDAHQRVPFQLLTGRRCGELDGDVRQIRLLGRGTRPGAQSQ